nr:translation initiation factor IF-2-like [Saimiri boliviensis boliviensis]
MTPAAPRGPPPSPRTPTRSRPHWSSSQHSLTRPTRTTRGPSFPPAPARTRASTRGALPAFRAGGGRGTAPRGGSASPSSPGVLSSSCRSSGRPASHQSLRPGKAQPLFIEDSTSGDTRFVCPPGLGCSPCSPSNLCLRLLPSSDPFPAKVPPPLQRSSIKFQKWRLQPPGEGPAPQSPESHCGQGRPLDCQAGVGDPGNISLLRCEGAGLTCPKVGSILDTLVGGSGQAILEMSGQVIPPGGWGQCAPLHIWGAESSCLLNLGGASVGTTGSVWAAFLGKYFPVGSWRGL